MEVLIPFTMAKLLDQGITAGNLNRVIYYGIILIVLAFVSMMFGMSAGWTAAVASTGFGKNLRKDLFYQVQTFSFSNIDRFSTASLVTRLTTDVTNVQNAFQMEIRQMVRAPILMVCALFFCFRLNADISMIYLFVVPALFVVLLLLVSRVHPIFQRVFNFYDRLNEVVQENLYGIRVVKSYRREDHENEKFGRVSQKIFADFSKAEKLMALNAPCMMVAVYGCILGISWLGAHIIVNTHGSALTTGELMSFFTYTIQILMALMLISMVLVMVIMARASQERIAEVLTEQSDIRNCADPVYEVPDGSIEFDHVQFAYSDKASKNVLTDINLKIKSGDTVGIIGGTGSAKSSLVQLIPRLYDVTGGILRVGGRDVRTYDLRTLRDQVAMVLQKNVLFSGTIKDNLRWGNKNATDEELVHACELAQADGFIREFPNGYDTYIEQGGTNVSGGQKQRICIARALLKKPKILILDDSTSAVDTKTDAKIRQAFLEDIPDTTKIIIAQRVSSVQDADYIVVMNDGKIDAVGNHDELLKSNVIYREVYESQQKGGGDDEATEA